MAYVGALGSVVVYAVIAGLAQSAGRSKVSDADHATTFPILPAAKYLIWAGSVLCTALGTYNLLSRSSEIAGVFFLAIGLITLLMPFQPVAVSPSGIEALRTPLRKGLALRWNEIERVEVWKAGRMVAVVHGKKSITHTRFHVDQPEFIRLLRSHITHDKWVEKGLR